jgi:hypothetical protein
VPISTFSVSNDVTVVVEVHVDLVPEHAFTLVPVQAAQSLLQA